MNDIKHWIVLPSGGMISLDLHFFGFVGDLAATSPKHKSRIINWNECDNIHYG
jgi:hypothetical protein